MRKYEIQAETFSVKIDKKLLSIDFNALNLIQMALFAAPNREIVIRLKKLFGIPYLTPQEVQQELNNIHSPLRKHLLGLMMSMIIRSQLLLDENFQKMLIILMEKENLKFIAELIEIEKRFQKPLQMHELREKLILLNQVATKVMNIIPMLF